MKFIALLFGLASVAAAVKQELYKLPQEKILIIKKIGNECALEHKVDPGLAEKIPDGTLPRDEATNKYLYCVTLKTGLVEEDGHMVVKKLADLLGDHPLAEELKTSIIKCNEVTKEDPISTVVEMNRCITSTAPVRFVL